MKVLHDPEETTRTVLEYTHPDSWAPIRYEQRLTLDAIGVLLAVMDFLADRTDPGEIRDLGGALTRAIAEAG